LSCMFVSSTLPAEEECNKNSKETHETSVSRSVH
jgi:hypothetical protein